MAIISKKVSEFPVATDPARFDIFGQDRTTGQSAKSQMSLLVGPTGPAPNVTITITSVPYGTEPSVDKSGTNTAPIFNIKFPLAADGKTPQLRVSGGYMQYRYTDADTWLNLFAMSTLKGDKGDKGDTGPQGQEGDTGAKGDTGEKGDTGDNGKTPVFNGSTSTALDPSADPTVSLTQTGVDASGNPIYALSFGIPQGKVGNTLFAAFEIDTDSGELIETTPDEYNGPAFEVDEIGNLNVII